MMADNWHKLLLPAVKAVRPPLPRAVVDIAEALCDTTRNPKGERTALAIGGKYDLAQRSGRTSNTARLSVQRLCRLKLIVQAEKGGRGRLHGERRAGGRGDASTYRLGPVALALAGADKGTQPSPVVEPDKGTQPSPVVEPDKGTQPSPVVEPVATWEKPAPSEFDKGTQLSPPVATLPKRGLTLSAPPVVAGMGGTGGRVSPPGEAGDGKVPAHAGGPPLRRRPKPAAPPPARQPARSVRPANGSARGEPAERSVGELVGARSPGRFGALFREQIAELDARGPLVLTGSPISGHRPPTEPLHGDHANSAEDPEATQTNGAGIQVGAVDRPPGGAA